MKRIHTLIAGTFATLAILTSCQRGHDATGWEFAPNMYNSVGYEPYTQINPNSINADGKNMREPVPGTVSRRNYKTQFDSTGVDLMIYHVGKDDIATAEAVLKNPVPNNEKTLAEGKALYGRYCQHCHGETGAGDGPVADMYKGVPNYKADAYLNMNDGHIFHVITHGKGRMWAHGSQVTPEERWKIAHYIHKLQKS
jgi:mono/diheme cytochrome c family protein